MRTKEGKLTYRGLIVVGAAFMALNALVIALLYAAATRSGQAETYQLAEETASFLEDTCEKNENVDLGYDAKVQQTLMDKARGFVGFLPSDEVVLDDELLAEYVRTEHMGGMVATDASGQVVAKADLNDKDSLGLFGTLLAKPAVQEILSHPNKTYTDTLAQNGAEYNVVALRYGDGLLLAYESLDMPVSDPYERRASDLLANNTFHKNPTVLMVQDGLVVSSNEGDDKAVEPHLDALLDESREWASDSLTELRLGNDAWYGIRASYKDCRFYILYSPNKVFEERPSFIAIGALVYLAICVIVLIIRGYADKRLLKATQGQLRIINSISMTFDTTFLLHLDDMTMEGIRMSEPVARIFAGHPDPAEFLASVCRGVIAPEFREAVAEFMDVGTFEDRLRGKGFLAMDMRAANGRWYSLQIIPQLRGEDGKLLATLVATRDVTDLKRAEELSFRDKLTGLRNRNYLESRGEEFVRSGDLPVSVLMADCNYLKRTNDTMGHEWGDELLKRVSSVLGAAVSGEGLAMRIGGDEFLLVCPHMDEHGAADLAKKIEAQLAAKSDDDLTLSVSLGTSTVAGSGTTFAEAFKAADEAMYVAKTAAHARG